jgi:two-component system LytT family response regulator
MSTLRVVLVDDEPLARSLLREYLHQHADVEIIAECGNGFEAVKAVVELKPDLMFLDIQMPRLDGFEVLELIGTDVNVIFVTAYDQYAVRAFQIHAVDYLLKPVSPERFSEALQHARERIARHEHMSISQLTADRQRGSKTERVLIREGANVHVIPVGKIDYVEAQDDYVRYRSEGRNLLKQQTLAEVEGLLDPTRFVRIHRSYILNIERLAKLELYAKDSHAAILRDGTRLPVSRAGYTKLNALL